MTGLKKNMIFEAMDVTAFQTLDESSLRGTEGGWSAIIADEIIIVDTGSNDETVTIIERQKLPTVLSHAIWQDDFSEIRNLMVKKSSGHWILSLDADEYLGENKMFLKPIIGLFEDFPEPHTVLSLRIVNHDYSEINTSKRLFKNNDSLQYIGLVHEALRVIETGYTPKNVTIDCIIHHDGYRPEIMAAKNKWLRNKQLLLKMVDVEKDNMKWHYLLAREMHALGEPAEMVEASLKKALALSETYRGDEEYPLACLVKLCEVYFAQNNKEALAQIIEVVKSSSPQCMDVYYYEMLMAYNETLSKLETMADDLYSQLASGELDLSVIHSRGQHVTNLLSRVYFSTRNDNKLLALLKNSKTPVLAESIEADIMTLSQKLRKFKA